MANVLSPSPKLQFLDNNGEPAVGYKLFTYIAGSSTKLDTYVSSAGAANTNPIILDYRGETNVWIPPNVAYKYVFAKPADTDPPANPIWTIDNLVSSQLVTLYGGVDTGSANAYVLNFVANFTSYTDGIVIYWIPSNSNTTTSTVNVNGLGPIQILGFNGDALVAGDIIANSTVGMIYRAGSFYLLYPAITAGSFTASLSGMTGTVTGSVSYRVVNRVVTLYASSNIQGTSNSSVMLMTGLPSAIGLSAGGSRLVPCALTDTGTGVLGMAEINLSLNRISFNPLNVSGASVQTLSGVFTASGTKGIPAGWTICYQI